MANSVFNSSVFGGGTDGNPVSLDPNDPTNPFNPSNPRYNDPTTIKTRQTMAQALLKRATAPFAPSWGGVVAAGLTGLHSGMETADADRMAKANMAMQSDAMRRASEAPDTLSMSKMLLQSGVPGLGEKGIDLAYAERQRMAKEASPLTQAQIEGLKASAEMHRAQAKTAGVKQEPDIIRTMRFAGIDPASPQGQALIVGHLKGAKPETAFDTEVAKGSAKDLGDRAKAIKASRDKLAKLQQLETLIGNPNVYQGKGGNLVLEAKKLAAQVGISTEGIPESETMRAIQNQLALALRNPAGGEGMPGPMSDKDRDFLVASVPGLQTTPAGNRLLVRVMRDFETYKIKQNVAAMEYMRQKKSSAGLDEYLQEWAAKNPMLSKEARSGIASVTGVQYGVKSGPVAGERVQKTMGTTRLADELAKLPRVATDQDYDALPAGARYVDPRGNVRTKQ